MAQRITTSQDLTRRLTLGLAFGFVVLLVFVFIADLQQVSAQVLAFRWSLFPPVIALTLLNYTLRFFKWQFYLRQVGVDDIRRWDSARLFVAGFPLAVTPGKVGEALKGVWLNRLTGIQTARGIAVVLAERISDGLAMIVLSILGLWIGLRPIPAQYWPAIITVLALLSAIIVISQIRPLALRLLAFAERLPLVNRFAHSLHEFYEGSFALFKPSSTLVAVALGILSWFCEGLGFYLILSGLGVEPGSKVLAIAVFVLSFSIVVGAVSTLPGGLGAAEASIAGLLVLLLGLATGTAAAATLLIRFATLWFGVALGLLIWTTSPHLLGISK
ncbi:MAG TPA: lysylphosphatidylglycerol synthase transmembrane domain-containing protein [Anaerolineales bacterium]